MVFEKKDVQILPEFKKIGQPIQVQFEVRTLQHECVICGDLEAMEMIVHL